MTPKPQTLADVIEALSDLPKIPARTKADLKSAIRCFGRVVDLDLIVAEAGDLETTQTHIAAARPERFGLSPARWSVIRSQVIRALTLTGAAKPLQTASTKMSSTWTRLIEDIPATRQRLALSRFARYCSQIGVDPNGVQQETFDRYRKALATGSLVRNPADIYRTTTGAWLLLPAVIAGTDLAWVEVPPSRAEQMPHRRLLSAFPQSFQDELTAFKHWCVTADPLDDRARPKALRPQTVVSYCSSLHTAADAALRAGVSLEAMTSIAVLTTADVFIKILRQLLADYDQKVSPTVHAVATTLVILAKGWLKQSPDQIVELKRLKGKLPKLQPGLTPKNRALLDAFDDEALLARFLLLPDQLWQEALPDTLPPNQRLVRAQMALLIGILQITPLRRRNMCAVTFGEHITWPNGPQAPAKIQVPAPEMKTNVDYVGELPLELSRRLHHYRTRLAPVITGVVPSLLFIRIDGKPKCQESVAYHLVVTLEKRLGRHMTMHQFRHMSGKLMLDHHPGAYETVAQNLGHTGTKNVVKFYGGADTKRASRHHAKLIENLREDARQRHSKSRKTRALP